MKEKMLRSIWLRVCMIVAAVTTAFAGSAWANEPITVELEGFSAYNGQIDGNISYSTTNGSVSNSNLTFETLTLMAKNNAKINAVTFHYASDDGVNAQWVFDGSTANFYVNGSANSPTISEKSCDNIVIRPLYTGNSLVMDYISVTYTPGDPAYEINHQSNDPNKGTVVLDGNVIIAKPEQGYGVADDTDDAIHSYDITSGAAYVVRKGNYFAVEPTSNCTVTINFVAHTGGYSLDFEKDMSTYENDWKWNAITRTAINESNPTAHQKKFYAKTNGAEAWIQTKGKIMYPGILSCYVCPIVCPSYQTTATWKVEVSSDETNWRDVANVDNKKTFTHEDTEIPSQGDWGEEPFTVDLSSETNVYVRIFYDSNNQSGIDDIQLTTATATVPVSVSSYGLSTFCCHRALDFTNSDIKVYYATADGTTLTFHQITKLPADTGVLLQKAGGVTDEEVPALIGTADAVPNTNVFVPGPGPDADGKVSYKDDDQNYILYQGEFYKANSNPVATNRAYIHLPNGNQVKDLTINLDADDTGIETIGVAQPTANDAIYNLAGQRLKKMQKGINIVNGKKMIQR